MEQTFTRESVTAAFEAIIAEFGADHRYTKQVRPDVSDPTMGCYYSLPEKTEEDTYAPACIVGQIVYRLDPDLFQVIGALESETGASCGAPSLLFGMWNSWSDEDGNMPEDMRVLIDDETGDVSLVNALSNAQSAQDRGRSWGEAFSVYREHLRLADQHEEV